MWNKTFVLFRFYLQLIDIYHNYMTKRYKESYSKIESIIA